MIAFRRIQLKENLKQPTTKRLDLGLPFLLAFFSLSFSFVFSLILIN